MAFQAGITDPTSVVSPPIGASSGTRSEGQYHARRDRRTLHDIRAFATNGRACDTNGRTRHRSAVLAEACRTVIQTESPISSHAVSRLRETGGQGATPERLTREHKEWMWRFAPTPARGMNHASPGRCFE